MQGPQRYFLVLAGHTARGESGGLTGSGVIYFHYLDDILLLGGIFALRAHCAVLLDYVPPEEPPSKPLGNALRIR